MKIPKIVFLIIIIGAIVGWAEPQGCAAEVPAGTTILIRTTNNIISNDPPGRAFQGVVARDIAVGKVVIPVGTPVRGIVKSPHFTVGSISRPLTLRLIGLTTHERTIAIESEDLECQSNSPWTIGHQRVQITGDAFMYNAGTLIPFRLKRSVTI